MTSGPGSAEAALAACSLRERKRARLRVGLWSELRRRIDETPFTEISVRELAASMEVSGPTVFANFPAKTDLFAYHICMWRIGTMLEASAAPDGIEFLGAFLDETARSIINGPRMWFEITAEVARGGGVCAVIDISPAERLLVFGDCKALDIPITPQAALFEHHLTIAENAGQLATTVPEAVTGLLAGFYGLPLAIGSARLDELSDAYRSHLQRFVSARRNRR